MDDHCALGKIQLCCRNRYATNDDGDMGGVADSRFPTASRSLHPALRSAACIVAAERLLPRFD